MGEKKKVERGWLRGAYSYALLFPFVCIAVAEPIGSTTLSIYLAAEAVEFACLVAILLFSVLFALGYYTRIRFF